MPLRELATSALVEQRLRRAMAEGFAMPFEATVFRSMQLEYASPEDAANGEGARESGGRWNPPGIATFYASTDSEVASKEVRALAKYYGATATEGLPRVEAAFDVQVKKALDLTDRRVLHRMSLTLTALREVDWRAANSIGHEAITQAIGRLSAALGIEALIVRSARVRGGRNLVAFPPLTPPSYIRPRGLDRLRGVFRH